MMRYIRLYLSFVKFSFMRAMEFRLDFCFRIVMDLIFYAVNIAFFQLLYLQTPTIAGWSRDQCMLFVAIYLVLDAIQMSVFSNNMHNLPFVINKGDLDYYLVRPVSSLFFVSLRDFAVNSFINFAFSIAILTWAIRLNPEVQSLSNVLVLLVSIFVGMMLHYFVQLLFTLPVFWIHSTYGFRTLFWSMSKAMERPDRIWTGGARMVFTRIVPLALCASYPARLYLEGWKSSLVYEFLFVTLLFGLIVGILWRMGLRAYSSASS